ncbi:hypothetical protein BDD12DRAFT_806760 [Trichophaea hybrida]|nr:hypothetical protein BDD12DRAFT_806760 [Trichophaea hybrida]
MEVEEEHEEEEKEEGKEEEECNMHKKPNLAQACADLRNAYYRLFAIFYHKCLQYDGSDCVDDVVKNLLELAEAYCSLQAVSGTIYYMLMESSGDPRQVKGTDTTRYLRRGPEEYIRIQELKQAVDKTLAYSMTPAALLRRNHWYTPIEKDTQREIEIAFEKFQERGKKEFYTTVSKIKGSWAEKFLKKLVAPLLECNLMLGLKEPSCSTLTCRKFSGEYPWENREEDR